MISLASVRDLAAIAAASAVLVVVDAVGAVLDRITPDLGGEE